MNTLSLIQYQNKDLALSSREPTDSLTSMRQIAFRAPTTRNRQSDNQQQHHQRAILSLTIDDLGNRCLFLVLHSRPSWWPLSLLPVWDADDADDFASSLPDDTDGPDQ